VPGHLQGHLPLAALLHLSRLLLAKRHLLQQAGRAQLHSHSLLVLLLLLLLAVLLQLAPW
jgi:hypothetical protein